MILTGPEILAACKRGDIRCEPLVEKHVGPNSLDLTLGPTLLQAVGPFDMKKEQRTRELPFGPDGFTLVPGFLYLGHTAEAVGSDRYVPCIEGRSSVGRLGISVHLTAGVGDLGFFGQWTLEIAVVQPVRVYPGVKLAQVLFYETLGRPSGYAGRYQGQRGPQPSRMWRDFL